MTDRQKFWLKVVLAVTLPVWIWLVMAAGILYLFASLFWEAADSIVEPRMSDWGD